MDDARRMNIAKDITLDAVVADKFDIDMYQSNWLRLLKPADKSDPRSNWINDQVNAIITR
jgi:hypothetical protein